ncbi:hypothetical protein BDP27DRAFT_1549098 [Rhodocollybia butyracea]|uniref:Uncharacterized protein n=1 Tax=Rhodocollybia butyracea TaxID=206335 RepID=A0A9P5PM06_9AGAR|nr:hypothetical protein BDP27DRAFT_1549098 [Rhodocollybia butyracea]
MASIRAYYLPTNSTSPIDASHPVSVKHLNALGWKLLSVGDNYNEIEQASRKLAQELGFPVTQEGCMVPFHYDLAKNSPTVDPEMVALLTKLVEVDDSNICLANEALVVVTSGSRYLDVEDVTTAGWIRIHFVTGMLVCVPTGAKYRLALDERNRKATGIAFFKETVSNTGSPVKEILITTQLVKLILLRSLGRSEYPNALYTELNVPLPSELSSFSIVTYMKFESRFWFKE